MTFKWCTLNFQVYGLKENYRFKQRLHHLVLHHEISQVCHFVANFPLWLFPVARFGIICSIKKREKHPWRSVTFSVFKLYKWHQIAQNIIYVKMTLWGFFSNYSANCTILFACYIYRNSRQRYSVKKDVLRNFAKFIGKHLCSVSFLIKLQAEGDCFCILQKRIYQFFVYSYLIGILVFLSYLVTR